MNRLCFATAAALALIGCGGQTGEKTTVVAGTVIDANSQPVRDARVSSRDGSATTSPTGAFSLGKQREGELELVAQITKDGRLYRGRTTVLNTRQGLTQSANIIIGAEDELATLRGNVRDRSGGVIEGASVYAYLGSGSSQRAFTDADGDFVLRDLIAGFDYEISAGGQGLRSDQQTVLLSVGEDRSLDFICGESGLPFLSPPANLGVTTWVSPIDSTRKPGADPYPSIKRLFDPSYRADKAAGGRGTGSRVREGSSYIEADLQWDERRVADLTGYGIYRASGSLALEGLDFLPEPLAAYYVDLDLRSNSTYRFGVTAISGLYPDFQNQSESDLSDIVTARTLSPLRLSSPTLSPLVFRWQAGSRAESFVVFVFDEFPGVDVGSIWNNSANRATGTSAVYDGAPLAKGRTYYYVVIGLADSDTSRTISQVGTFKL